MRLRAGACSDQGKVRSLNEDTYAAKPELGLFVVSDGMGGEAAGEVASRLAVETIVAQLDAAAAAGDSNQRQLSLFLPRTRRLEAALQIAHQAIRQESQRDSSRSGMGATVVGAWVRDNIASLAHVGDSRAYLWHNRELQQLTQDHSLAEEQVRVGLLTREQSHISPNQNVLLRALGRGEQVEVELAEVPLMAGDYLVLCTDGLTRMVAEPALAETITNLGEPQKICDHLVALANQNGGVDNTTVVVVEVGQASWWQRLREGLETLKRRSRR
jgi:protein phosphatase